MNFQKLSRAYAATLHFWRGIMYFTYNLNSIAGFNWLAEHKFSLSKLVILKNRYFLLLSLVIMKSVKDKM